ncbi:MAG: gliding motility protein GldN [Cytophagaceae bacterium]|jgi:gliding motility associated protien GldN|nr:gliding motility protein GldN [Cytophagaceae bacterium]
MKRTGILRLAMLLVAPVWLLASDPMFSTQVIRALDLREKQNQSWFSKNNEITSILLEAAMDGHLKAYTSDSLNRTLPLAELENRLQAPDAKNLPTDTLELYAQFGEEWKKIVEDLRALRWMPRDIYQMEIKEHMLFDRKLSQWKYAPEAITLYIPADHAMNPRGIQDHLVSFDYKEVYAYLRQMPSAIWYNTVNPAEHKNMADAMELRLFSSYIINVSNPSDAYLADIYGGNQHTGIMASQWAATTFMEYEHHLWEF